MALTLKNSSKAFGGLVRKYTHASAATRCTMTFTVFVPGKVTAEARGPALYYLSGLTCTDDNFIQKAGAIRHAAEHGLVLVCPDTSPRGDGVPNDDAYDFGHGAGFYVNATEAPWSANFHMYDYVTKELPELVAQNFPVTARKGVFGHSMGGFGALMVYLRNPGAYASVSAFSPICHPSACPWGEKAFGGYLGADREAWKQYDPVELVGAGAAPKDGTILIDQGKDDEFLAKGQLLPDDFKAAADKAGVPVDLRVHDGYDHSYNFIASFVEDHIRHHARALLD